MLKKDQFALDKEAWCNLNQPDCSEEDVDIVIFGIPYDKGVSYRGGCSRRSRLSEAERFHINAVH